MPEVRGTIIGWDASAKLLRKDGELADGAYLRGGPVADGSLFKMVTYVMAQPEGERWRYEIATDGPMLDGADILALAGQLDGGI